MATIVEQCNGNHSKNAYLNNPHIMTIGERRYAVCAHREVGDLEPCGRLIDVTDLAVIRVGICCGQH